MCSNEQKNFKLCLVGDNNTGKTTFIHKILLNGEFEEKYVPTLGVNVHSIKIDNKNVTVWDTASRGKFAGLADGYYIGADAFIIFTRSGDTNAIEEHLKDISRTNSNPRIIVYVNKNTSYAQEHKFIKSFCLKKASVEDLKTLIREALNF